MKKNLVIVESPAKARTLTRILGKKYSLMASLGHVRDLPKSALGVDVQNSFAPRYVVPRDKSKIVKGLKQAVKDAAIVYLATDPDREGEAISWHLAEVTRDKEDGKEYQRITFHEITKEAIEEAFRHPQSINMQLVNAQQARRVLDRLVGYKISPILWRKVRRGLSAGRVQSVALRIIVEREREIEKFVPVEYWVIEVELTKKSGEKAAFRAALVGLLDGGKLDIHHQKEADDIKSRLESAGYSVLKVATKKVTRQPAPPFTTSTLQQEAWRKLRFSAKQTMAIAQQLYEGLPVGDEGEVGLITYMRTDSVRVAESAITEVRKYIQEKHGGDYLPGNARAFRQTARGAQEAHEAIRPTSIHHEPTRLKKYLSAPQLRLYDLIWKRMVASQMAAITLDNTIVDIAAKCPKPKYDYLLRTTASVIVFPGFSVLYTESRDEDEKDEDKILALPPLKKDDILKLLGVFPDQRFTQPPPRFTDATLVKMLEQKGIGRPSTYAPTLSTIQEREYVTKSKGVFQPTELGFVVNDLLVEHFPDIMNIEFTARMEDNLDEIATNHKNWVSVIQDFYQPFEGDVEKARQSMEKVKLPDRQIDEACPQCGKPIVVKLGRFGKFLACSGYPECKYTRRYEIKTGVRCPQCGGDLVEKMSKKKKVFYGCSKYPECKFATFSRPLPEPCPKCGGLVTEFGKNWKKCTKCTYREKLEQEQ